MRVIKTQRYKLIFNIAHGLEFPLAKDLLQSPTWVSVQEQGLELYGKRTPDSLLDRARIEMYDLKADPHEINNLADDPKKRSTRERLEQQLREFQLETGDPWAIKWERE